MNAYWTAQLEAIWSGEAPIWEAQVLENVLTGSILSTHDDGDTWHLTRMDDFNDVLAAGGLAFQDGRAGETIKMTSRGGAGMQVVAPSYPVLIASAPTDSEPSFILGEMYEDGTMLLDLREDGA